MAVYTCDACRFTFERSGDIGECPDCGKPSIRTAAPVEMLEFRRNHGGIWIDLDPVLRSKGMTAEQLAEQSGVALAEIQAMCDGSAKDFSLTGLDRICDILACTPADIIHWKKRK